MIKYFIDASRQISQISHNCLSVYEAVLPLPNCMKEEGCRSILERKDGNDGFELDGDFIISTKVFFTNIHDPFK